MSDTDTINFAGPLPDMHLNAHAYTVIRFVGEQAYKVFDFDPPYQRGSVWSRARKANLIRSLLMGVPFGSITVNERDFGMSPKPYVIIDGKQRVEAVRDFTSSCLPIPVTWIADEFIDSSEDVDGWPVPGVRFESTTIPFQHRFINLPMPTNEARAKTIEEEAEIYRLLNTGGVGQTTADLNRAAAVENGTAR